MNRKLSGWKETVAPVLFVASVLVTGNQPAIAQDFNQFVGFGDSTIDSGSFRSLPSPEGGNRFNALWLDAVAAGAGRPTTSPGLMSSEALAAAFGLSAAPSDQGGTNFATSGSKNVTANDAETGGFRAAVPTVQQIDHYLAGVGGKANSNALYLISSGANDVAFAAGNSGTTPPADPHAYLVTAAQDLASAVAKLQAAGARFIVVPNLPFSFPTDDAALRQDRLLYSQTLWSSLSASGVNFIPADFNAMRVAIAANKEMFGFKSVNPNDPACTNPGVDSSWALLCSSNPAAPSHLVEPNADQNRLFADNEHLTSAGQKILADYEYSLIVAPSEISFLAEIPVKTRAAVVDSIFNQIAISQRQRRSGTFNVWVTGDVASLAMDSGARGFANDPGIPAAITGGIDYSVGNGLLIGAAVSYGHTTQSFDIGGNFKQRDIAGSLYGAYDVGPYWGRIIGSYGGLDYNVNRVIPIGITVQSNTGRTKGSNTSLAAEFGYDFVVPLGEAAGGAGLPVKAAQPAGPQITHGPVVGMVLQHVTVNGYTETDAFSSIGGFTALSFADQTRNSAVSELGYQASIDWGRWRPFAKVVWNHELASTNRSVMTTLTSSVAPSFSMPAVVLGKDWGTATIGTTATFAPGVTGYTTFTGQIAQQNVITYGGQVGLNVALH
jgi:outer membrane lipase/esterase